MLAAFSFLFATATTVLGHGYVQEVVTSSGTYTGSQESNGPVEDVTLIDVQCNGYTAGGLAGSTPAPAVAVAAAGTNVALNWTTWPDSHVGPVITYMARAPSDVTSWNPGTDAVWFKVAEQGLENGKWAATDILTGENNSIYTFTIPPTLKAGQYIIRHEIIALHSAYAYPGAQFYPSCIQVEVTGSGTETGPSELVAFPGAYTSSTPGIVFDVYKGATEYPIPGPAVWTGGSGSSSQGLATSATGTSAAASSTVASGTSTRVPVNTSTAVVSSATSTSSAPGATSTATGTVAQYGQCGGLTYTGPTTCASPYTCKYSNDYYSQCL
ncbi:Polysaccharide monooxygenase [Ceratobasidium theobromae]|uniref:lytic cellulose monooxygenase (C4-dehydrogenating) n=1 Tax=Ceratobasidium theobromae TaxID=1582974 RepID=A0A5N5QGA7_9AGAM|nr:Polysaccharide monooxygenase [Ceratobasidium theobromae]